MGRENCPSKNIQVLSLGLLPYKKTLELQINLVSEVMERKKEGALILVRHPPVFTIGRSGKEENIFVPNVEVVKVQRGGDITFHGPGQLVAYPIWNLHLLAIDVIQVVRILENASSALFLDFGINPTVRKGYPGLWVSGVSNKKIASIGLATKKGITYHGIAMNITEDDQHFFSYINPCGMSGTEITSIERETGAKPYWKYVEDIFLEKLTLETGFTFTSKQSCHKLFNY